MKSHPLDAIFRSFWVSPQKPSGGNDQAARQHINFGPFSGFFYELPRNHELPPGGATLSTIVLCCLMQEFLRLLEFYACILC